MTATSAPRTISSYHFRDHSEITFYSDEEGGLFVTIDTERLHMRTPIKEKDYAVYVSLFGDEQVMKTFASGATKTPKEVGERIDAWMKRWKEGDPYAGMAVFLKSTGEFLGHAVLGHGDNPGESELAGLGNTSFWNKGYGGEAALALVKDFAPLSVELGFTLKGKPLTKVVATALKHNIGSVKILFEKLGMKQDDEIEKFGAVRYLFSTKV